MSGAERAIKPLPSHWFGFSGEAKIKKKVNRAGWQEAEMKRCGSKEEGYVYS